MLTALQSVKGISTQPWTRRYPNTKAHLFYEHPGSMFLSKIRIICLYLMPARYRQHDKLFTTQHDKMSFTLKSKETKNWNTTHTLIITYTSLLVSIVPLTFSDLPLNLLPEKKSVGFLFPHQPKQPFSRLPINFFLTHALCLLLFLTLFIHPSTYTTTSKCIFTFRCTHVCLRIFFLVKMRFSFLRLFQGLHDILLLSVSSLGCGAAFFTP